jgi:prophage maintenance system killer protein
VSVWRYLTADDLVKLGAQFDVGPVLNVAELEAAVTAPSASYGGVDRHQDVASKAAALAFAIAKIYHPFMDGNKRAAAIGMLATCWLNGYRPKITQPELVGMIMAVAEYESGTSGDDAARAELADFLRRRLI